MAGKLDSIFTGEAGVAKRLIDKFGGAAVCYRKDQDASDYDPITGERVTVYEPIDVKMSPPSKVTKENVPGSSVEIGDEYAYIPSTDITIVKLDTNSMDIEYKSYGKRRMVSYSPLYSGELIAAYKVFMRDI